MKIGIAFDDHDSQIAGCTTHFGYSVIKAILKKGAKLLDFPWLIRLNPNIPWKTRGNAAVAIWLNYDDPLTIFDIVWNMSLEYIETVSRADKMNRSPGIAMVAESKTDVLNNLYIKALTDVITLDVAEKVARKTGALVRGKRGIIGSLASLGFFGEFTFEMLVYRKPEYWGTARKISITKNLDDFGFPSLFGNYDYIRRKLSIISHGKDPVFYGIRGKNPVTVASASKLILSDEKYDGKLMFKTNQGTDAHFIKTTKNIYGTIIKEITVRKISKVIGGDVIIEDENGLKFIIYKETGELNTVTSFLIKGDKVRIWGDVKPSSIYGSIIDVERIEILTLEKKLMKRNPKCTHCGGPTESVGKNKGFRCKRCGNLIKAEKEINEIPRNISEGLYYSRVYRHLTKPIFLL
ncbi:hypothetical protein HS7_07740 [Sulfolobales archaeon HS-7]|nr:hypothetical protein HS7_07740 [Sulfolobales archaeon HS-7]